MAEATARARAEAQAAINAALDAAKQEAAARIAALNERLEKQLHEAEAQIDAARAAAMSALREVATETAATVISRLTGAPPDHAAPGRRRRRGSGRAPDRLKGAAPCTMTSFFADPRNWVLIAFVLFFIIFGRKLWSALAKMLDDRASKVRAELEEAARLRREAEAMLRDAEARRAEALREAQALIEGAKTEAGRVAAAAAAEAEASARRREQMAMDRIAAAEKAAVDEVRLTAVEVATAAARQVIAEGLSADADSRLIDHAITQLPGALSGRRVA